MALKKEDNELIEEAKKVLNLRKSDFSKTGCALRTKEGKIFTAVNIKIHDSAPCSVCAEQIAIGNAVSEGYDKIESIVAVGSWKTSKLEVISPCGNCREFMKQFGNPYILTQYNNTLIKRKLNQLIPD